MKNPFGFLFGRGQKAAAPEFVEQFARAKEAALIQVLGQPHNQVLHAIIPFFVGGALDLYPFPCPFGGTLFATQEVIDANPRNGPKRSPIGRYELVACTRDPFVPTGQAPAMPDSAPASRQLVASILNPVARYSHMAVLKPGETIEIPGDAPDGSDALHVLLDEYPAGQAEFRILDELCGLMLCIAIHRSECDFSRAKGSGRLIERLKSAGVYPFSDLGRTPVA